MFKKLSKEEKDIKKLELQIDYLDKLIELKSIEGYRWIDSEIIKLTSSIETSLKWLGR